MPLLSDQVSEFSLKGGGQIDLKDLGLLQQVTIDADIRRFFGGIGIVGIAHRVSNHD